MKTRNDAVLLLNEYVSNESLRRHCYAVAFAMEAYAVKLSQEANREQWFICGLLHDFDYEKFPTVPQHANEGAKILTQEGFEKDVVQAILGHVSYTGVARDSMMSKCLFAVDELAGFIVAMARVRADGFASIKTSSVEKALKNKTFAAAVSREDINQGITELGVNRDEHFETVVSALAAHSAELLPPKLNTNQNC